MVVPDSEGTLSGVDADPTASAVESFEDQQVGEEELEEVRKLRELVRRLEVQNEGLRNRGSKVHMGANGKDRTLSETDTMEMIADPSTDLNRDPSMDSFTVEDMAEDAAACGLMITDTAAEQMQTQSLLDFPLEGCEFESDAAVDQSALDEVDVLDLDDCAEDEDSWLYVSPKKQVQAAQGPESPLKWCRKVLDHPSPETEVACRSLLNRLDQSSRWRSMYCSPTPSSAAEAGSALSPGYHKSTNKNLLTCGGSGYVHSALSSQSSIDSELSTSDDSISMGYKLQDLTDVQIMARLQEESLRQDYASSSASASRRSSAASLHSLRRGTYSDQELDSYSLEDEDTEGLPLSFMYRRHSPSPGTSPRCPSPSGYPGSTGARLPRRTLQGAGAEILKLARSEEELRHSMPNLAPRTSLRSLEAVRNSRSMEANLHSSGSRMSRLPQSPSGMSSTKLRSNTQAALSLRAPMKALSPVGTMTAARQPTRAPSGAQGGRSPATRRVQSPGPANGATYSACRSPTVAPKQTAGRSLVPGNGTSSRGRLSQTPRSRSVGMSKTCTPATDDSWKEGCY